MEMAIAVVIGTVGGSWLDERYGTHPTFALIGMFLGVAAGFRGVFRVVRAHERDMKMKAERERQHLKKKAEASSAPSPSRDPEEEDE